MTFQMAPKSTFSRPIARNNGHRLSRQRGIDSNKGVEKDGNDLRTNQKR